MASCVQFDVWTSPPIPCPDCWMLEWETGPLCEYIEPTEAPVLLIDDIWGDGESPLYPAITSGLKSDDDDDDGAKVAILDPTGYGATGISVREDADGLLLSFFMGWSNLHKGPNWHTAFCE